MNLRQLAARLQGVKLRVNPSPDIPIIIIYIGTRLALTFMRFYDSRAAILFVFVFRICSRDVNTTSFCTPGFTTFQPKRFLVQFSLVAHMTRRTSGKTFLSVARAMTDKKRAGFSK